MRLQDRVAIVTGAGTGIGRAIARRFAAEGAQMIVTDIDIASGQDVVAEIVAAGGRAAFFPLDVADPEAVLRVMQQVRTGYGRLDTLVNNAAITACYDDVLTMTPASWQRVIDVNLTGTFFCAQGAARIMAADGGGRIINMASVGSFMPQAHVPHYIAAKGGVLMLTRALALDLARYHITVNAIAPGPIRTERQEEAYASGRFQRVLAHVLMGRAGYPSEVAHVAAFLASDEASFITGETIVVDGGFLVGLEADQEPHTTANQEPGTADQEPDAASAGKEGAR